jgi:DNA repair photolyase
LYDYNNGNVTVSFWNAAEKNMEPKQIRGKAIRSPQGRAGEYARYACDFFCGCSCGCTYCYNKTGRFKGALGGDKPTLKKCFKDEDHALNVFEKELKANLPELQKHGLFFSFLTDPMLEDCFPLIWTAINTCNIEHVPVKILTKTTTNWIDVFMKEYYRGFRRPDGWSGKIAFGFTLTGHDEIETGASTNIERIKAMKQLHEAGFKTFASIEPIVDFDSSYIMIKETLGFCDLYKIGLMRGKKYLKSSPDTSVEWGVQDFAVFVYSLVADRSNAKIYFKDSLLAAAGIRRENLPANCVTSDYNIFSKKPIRLK